MLDYSVDPPDMAASECKTETPAVETGDWRGNHHSPKPCLHIPRVERSPHRLTTLVLKASPAILEVDVVHAISQLQDLLNQLEGEEPEILALQQLFHLILCVFQQNTPRHQHTLRVFARFNCEHAVAHA
jgi:hypothetical protein